MVVTDLAPQPRLPPGERLSLPGRGTTFVRSLPGPPGAPTVLLLHGWIASAGLNWLTAFAPLGERYRVIAPDMRGHARGLRSRRRFRLADCADDMAALLELMEAGPAIVVGYSMGGPIAQLLWRRHEAAVSGLVLCATADRFVTGARERFLFTSMMATAASTTRVGELVSRIPVASARRLAPLGSGSRPTSLRTWAAAEMRRHDAVKIMEAGQAIGTYNARRWIGEVDVPTTVMVTDRDRAIAPAEQLRVASRIPGALVHRIDDGHMACSRRGFGPALVRAVDSVDARIPRAARRRTASR
jgi:3-oxoadipate enol-lactonase